MPFVLKRTLFPLSCDGSIRLPSSNLLEKSLGYQLALFTANPLEEEIVICKLSLLCIVEVFLLERVEVDANQKSGSRKQKKKASYANQRTWGQKPEKENKCRNRDFVVAVAFAVSVVKFNLSAILLRKHNWKMSRQRDLPESMAWCIIGRLESGQKQRAVVDAVVVTISVIDNAKNHTALLVESFLEVEKYSVWSCQHRLESSGCQVNIETMVTGGLFGWPCWICDHSTTTNAQEDRYFVRLTLKDGTYTSRTLTQEMGMFIASICMESATTSELGISWIGIELISAMC
ncbi:hypothetical protein TNCV_3451701 [Trichonephila clavipes]|nr:hypothetical protein TNCV_3451701 [Trichonephila clavipes]